jgi:hypothetical protein
MADPAQSAEHAMVRVPRQNAGQCRCRVSRAVVGGGRLLTRLAVIVVRVPSSSSIHHRWHDWRLQVTAVVNVVIYDVDAVRHGRCHHSSTKHGNRQG